ncbi:hypothetical protein D3C72_2044150 [compost metagenome]
MLTRRITVGRPQDRLAEARRNDGQRRFLRALIGTENADLGAINVGRIVAQREEANAVASADHRLVSDDAEHRTHVEGRGLDPHVGAGQSQILTTLPVGAEIISILPCPVHADAERTRRPVISGF